MSYQEEKRNIQRELKDEVMEIGRKSRLYSKRKITQKIYLERFNRFFKLLERFEYVVSNHQKACDEYRIADWQQRVEMWREEAKKRSCRVGELYKENTTLRKQVRELKVWVIVLLVTAALRVVVLLLGWL